MCLIRYFSCILHYIFAEFSISTFNLYFSFVYIGTLFGGQQIRALIGQWLGFVIYIKMDKSLTTAIRYPKTDEIKVSEKLQTYTEIILTYSML